MGIELGIGAAVSSWAFGSAATGLAGIAAGAIAGAIDMAIVGAAVGGLTSAVMGGDILQGVLVGAVGGAVTGGVMGAFNPASFGVAGAGSMESLVSTTGANVQASTGVIREGANILGPSMTNVSHTLVPMKESVGALGVNLGASGAGEVVKTGMGELLGAGVTEGAKAMLGSKAAADKAERDAAARALEREHELKMLDKQLAAKSGGGAGVPTQMAFKPQQLASQLAQIASQEKLQAQQWRKEDTAKAAMRAAAKSIGRSKGALNKPPELTASERQALVERAQESPEVDMKDAATVARETMDEVQPIYY